MKAHGKQVGKPKRGCTVQSATLCAFVVHKSVKQEVPKELVVLQECGKRAKAFFLMGLLPNPIDYV